jgi:anaerobic magnesium-protoporphyrin IX monomethyl ester cyclase
MKVMLLNPPAKELYLRDMYSSTKSKWGYSWPPADILMLSGVVGKEHEIQLLDANILGLSFEEALEKIDADIGAVIFMTGSSSLTNDLDFIRQVKKVHPSAKAIGTGGCLLHNSEYFLEKYPVIDAILYNFITYDILDYLSSKEKVDNVIYKKTDGEIIKGEIKLPSYFQVPVPRHDLLPIEKYNLPHGRRRPITSLVASYGCPYNCAYCVSQNVRYIPRSVDNCLEELRFINKLGIKEVIFRDNTFGVVKEDAKNLCRRIIEEKIDITWVCDSRVNVMNDDELLSLMKSAGCHTIHFGLESGDDKILEKYGKGITHDEMFNTFRLCKKNRIKTMGYFIIGLPGENAESVLKTIELAKKLDCDYASFNVPIPIYGTRLRDEAIREKWIDGGQTEIFDGSYFPTIGTDILPASELWELRNLAIRKFYLRPAYIFKKLSEVRSFYDAKILWQNFKLLFLK